MDTTDLVQLWKQPAARHGAATGHPAGEIRLRSGGGLGRRSQLLGESSAFRGTSPWTTVSIELHDESHADETHGPARATAAGRRGAA
ncbi:hypothetical protein SSTG_04681 [Streptomyces sp. e14]|uniref:hypothetical protein n=1 Tax=Streptomyces sp. e14 TaxID=645465 RepID=UPI0001D060E0|nr:hypothetical protein [Streptomyces sp. e14]EFF88811.1 hypothetical protein SSTG_04681 [Streptomyces sp. e14]